MSSPKCRKSSIARVCAWRKNRDHDGTTARPRRSPSNISAQTIPQQTEIFVYDLAVHLDGARGRQKVVGLPVQAIEVEGSRHDRSFPAYENMRPREAGTSLHPPERFARYRGGAEFRNRRRHFRTYSPIGFPPRFCPPARLRLRALRALQTITVRRTILLHWQAPAAPSSSCIARRYDVNVHRSASGAMYMADRKQADRRRPREQPAPARTRAESGHFVSGLERLREQPHQRDSS